MPRGFSQGRRAEKLNINKMASKITSTSEVNTGSLSSVSIPNCVKVSLSTSLNVAMKVRIIQVIRMSAVVFFSDKSSREDSLDMLYEESHSGQDNLRNVSQRSDMGNQRIQNDSKKRRNHIFAEIRLYTPFRPFLDALL